MYRVDYIVELLNDAGVSVQLKFLQKEADLVRVIFEGKEVAMCPDLQNNKNYYDRKSFSERKFWLPSQRSRAADWFK
jgi:hypothetical protein